jgi:hypothetical protein
LASQGKTNDDVERLADLGDNAAEPTLNSWVAVGTVERRLPDSATGSIGLIEAVCECRKPARQSLVGGAQFPL